MRTGDLATIDAHGYCNIVGRIKDMVIWGGENIYPRRAGVLLMASTLLPPGLIGCAPEHRHLGRRPPPRPATPPAALPALCCVPAGRLRSPCTMAPTAMDLKQLNLLRLQADACPPQGD